MNCRQTKQLLSAYLDQGLDTATRKKVRDHLCGCENCRKELALLRAVTEKLAQVPPVSAPDDFLIQLNEKMQRESGWQRFVHALWFPFRMKLSFPFAAATAMAVLIIFVIHIKQPEVPMQDFSKNEKPGGGVSMNFPEEEPFTGLVDKDRGHAVQIPETRQKSVVITDQKLLSRSAAEWTLAIKPTHPFPVTAGMAESEQKKGDFHAARGEVLENGRNTPDVMPVPSKEKKLSMEEDAGEMDTWVQIIATAAEKYDGKIVSDATTGPTTEGLSMMARLIVVTMPALHHRAFYEDLESLNQFYMPPKNMVEGNQETSLIHIRLLP